ncbi:hypothetical protein [Streptomyces sp. 2132.2]|uniref:hypothetical protein n=1 Tax=Streptomyces sp. 2132.2 TaxID=2485161 RepID=UPI0037DA6A3C
MTCQRPSPHGPASAVVTAELVREVFGLDAVVGPDPVTGSPPIVPSSRGARRPDAGGPQRRRERQAR